MLKQSTIFVWNLGEEKPPSLDATLPEEIGVGLAGTTQPVLCLLLADLAMQASLQNIGHCFSRGEISLYHANLVIRRDLESENV